MSAEPRSSRRQVLAAGAAMSIGALLRAGRASARPRIPSGGKISLRVPWPVGAVDPHRLDDAMAAIFGEALFDTLYVRDEAGQFVPGLAETEPEPDGANLRVKLRSGLRTGKNRPFGTKDASWSLARARGSGAKGWLGDIPAPRDDGRALVFATKDAARLVRALASPLVAMVPTGFSPEAPDGTGAFRFVSRGDGVAFVRNALAARGPAFLDEVAIKNAPNLSSSLLAFESGTDDVGWLERGLHEKRANSLLFDFGAVAWAALFTGRDAGTWDAPGVAQQICDGIPYTRLADLHLGPPWTAVTPQGWGGAPTTLLVREDSPWMVAVANAIAATIARPGHEVTAKPVSASELAQRRSTRLFALALDLVRPAAQNTVGSIIAIATADDPARGVELAQHPPKLGNVSARTLTRTLRCGIVGEVRVKGGRMPDLALAASNAGSGVDLAASYRIRAR